MYTQKSGKYTMKHRPGFGLIFVLFMLFLTACSRDGSTSSANASSGPQDVQVTLSDYRVDSSITTFTAGKPYRFIVSNNGQAIHEFMVMSPMSMGNTPMDQMDKTALTYISSIDPNQKKTVEYTFPSSSTTQTLEFSCHLSNHYELGMKLPVKVNK